MPFLEASDHYPIQEALETCTNHVRELVDERIFILARGASINYVDKILRIFNPPPPFVDKLTT